MKVGYLHFYGLGDNIFAIWPLFALKKIFNCEVIVFGNAIMQNILINCDFVDLVHNIDGDIANHIDTINSHCLDYAILTNCKRCYLRPLEKSNVGKIITTTKIPSLFSIRCKTVPLHLLPHYRSMPSQKKSLLLIRAINPNVFDSKIESICLDDARIQTTIAQKEKVKQIIQKHISTLNIKTDDKYRLILINPFSNTANHTLPLESYLEIIWIVGNMQNCIPIVATYPAIHDSFVSALKVWQSQTQRKISNMLIFQNDNNILNLAALIEQVHCVISPSTGTIHLASNLCISTIGLFSKLDTIKWSTRSNQYVVLPKPKNEMSTNDINEAITKTIQLLKANIIK